MTSEKDKNKINNQEIKVRDKLKKAIGKS